jgi:ketosteroid isomerase-like protein
MSISLRERIYEIYKAFSAGQIDLLADMFDERVDFMSNAPREVFPYLGRLLGRAAVMQGLAAVHQEFDSIAFVPLRIIIDDDQSAGIIVSIQFRQRATGRMIRLFAAHFLRFQDNRIIEYRAFLDTFEAVQQVLGHEIDLGTTH